MFLSETYSAEYIETYVKENVEQFKNKKLVIVTVCEQGINLLELLQKQQIYPVAFADTNEKVLGKEICGLPVIRYSEIEPDAYIIVSSAITAYHDRKILLQEGFLEHQILTIYPAVIEYFRESFEQIDQEHYGKMTKAENDAYVKEEIRGAIEVKSLPTMLILDLTTRCNLNCRHCEAHHDKAISRVRNQEENYMKPSRYKQILDMAGSVYLNISGEPLMSPKFWEVLDYIDASNNDPLLFTVTNGILLDKKASDRIVASKFKKIYISMDAATDQTYRRLRGGDFTVWYENVRYLVEAKKKADKNLTIVLQHTVSREALEETVRAAEIAEKLGVDEIAIRPLYTDIAGKENWLVPMDENVDYYYPQQDVKYYPNLTQKVMDEVRRISKDYHVKVDISSRFAANANENMQDFPYPLEIDKFKELQQDFEKNVPQEVITEVPELAKDIPLCDGPWVLSMVFTNGNIMYCNRMAQAEGNLNFSSIYDLRNTKTVQDIRRGLVENDISWHCYYCSGCTLSDYAKHLKKEKEILEKGTNLNFAIDDTAELKKIVYHGLSRIQRNGTWNNLDESKIEFYLTKDDHTLSVNAEAFVIPGLVDSQKVNVFVNDKKVASWVYKNDQIQENSISVPMSEVGEDGKVVLGFCYENGVSPLSLGIGRDDRKRAIFIHKIEIK